MIKITVNNSYSIITGLTAGQHKDLSNELSYLVDSNAAFFSGGFGPKRRSLLAKSGEFATGLLHRVCSWCSRTKEPFEVVNQRKVPKTSSKAPKADIIPDKAQRMAVHEATVTHHGIISMPTGTGKTLVIALIAARLGVATLVVVPSLEIKKQMLGALKSYLDDTSYIRIENIDSTALNKLTGFDCLIIDEAHHSAAKTYRKLNKTAWKGIYYRFFMTATPFRNDNEETLLFESICGQVVYTLAYTEAVKSKRIVPVEAYYIEVPKKKTDAHTWGQVYSQLVVNNEDRNMQIALIALRLNSECIPTLILVKEVKHGELLSNMTGLPFANGKDEETREYIQQFNAGKIKALIGTEGILGEGVDTKPCEYVIIGGLGKAKSAFMQKVGRAVRAYVGKESAKVVLFCDKSHKFTLKHFKEQCKILKEEYQVTAIKLDL